MLVKSHKMRVSSHNDVRNKKQVNPKINTTIVNIVKIISIKGT